MKTIKYIILGIVISLIIMSSFSFSSSNKNFTQTESVRFCSTYTQQEVLARLNPEDKFYLLVETEHRDPESSWIGSCPESNIERLWEYVQSDAFKVKVKEDLNLVAGIDLEDGRIPIYAIRESHANREFPVHDDLEEVRIMGGSDEPDYVLLITFSESGSEKWAAMTRTNTGRDIAILSEGKVVAAPRVQEEIRNGRCMISGNFTESEINRIKAALEN